MRRPAISARRHAPAHPRRTPGSRRSGLRAHGRRERALIRLSLRNSCRREHRVGAGEACLACNKTFWCFAAQPGARRMGMRRRRLLLPGRKQDRDCLRGGPRVDGQLADADPSGRQSSAFPQSLPRSPATQDSRPAGGRLHARAESADGGVVGCVHRLPEGTVPSRNRACDPDLTQLGLHESPAEF